MSGKSSSEDEASGSGSTSASASETEAEKLPLTQTQPEAMEVSSSGDSEPETAKPETPKPETAKPETAKPETARPDKSPGRSSSRGGSRKGDKSGDESATSVSQVKDVSDKPADTQSQLSKPDEKSKAGGSKDKPSGRSSSRTSRKGGKSGDDGNESATSVSSHRSRDAGLKTPRSRSPAHAPTKSDEESALKSPPTKKAKTSEGEQQVKKKQDTMSCHCWTLERKNAENMSCFFLWSDHHG